MGFQSVVRWLLPHEDHFYDFLERQAQVAHETAVAFEAFKTGDATAVSNAVQELEHKGDAIVHEMEEALAKTFVTPIDREDLQKLSSDLDDIIDRTNGAVRSCALFGVDHPTPAMSSLMDTLVECTRILRDGMPDLRRHAYSELIATSRKLRTLEKKADGVFRAELSELFHDDKIDAKRLFREKEVLEDLEKAIDHCEQVADTLTNLSVKHG
jgi:uncharacterized protein Yka (UPF0111/DUF47 family)